jgi:hypothetical protein
MRGPRTVAPGSGSEGYGKETHQLHQHLEVSDDGCTVAAAEVIISGEPGGTARVSLRAEAGHITPGRRASLVDAALDLPAVRQSARLEAAFPLGDGESLQRLQQRCQDVSTRPAGCSALLDASLPPGRPDSTAQQPAGQVWPGSNRCRTGPASERARSYSVAGAPLGAAVADTAD